MLLKSNEGVIILNAD